MLDSSDVIKGLTAIAGSSVLAGLINGFIGYKTEALKGRRENGPDRSPRGQPLEPGDVRAANGPMPGSHDIELLANAGSQLAGSLIKLCLLVEFHMCAEHGDPDSEKFREFARDLNSWIDDQHMREALRAFQAQRASQPAR